MQLTVSVNGINRIVLIPLPLILPYSFYLRWANENLILISKSKILKSLRAFPLNVSSP